MSVLQVMSAMRYDFPFSGCLLAGTLRNVGSIEKEGNEMGHVHKRRDPWRLRLLTDERNGHPGAKSIACKRLNVASH